MDCAADTIKLLYDDATAKSRGLVIDFLGHEPSLEKFSAVMNRIFGLAAALNKNLYDTEDSACQLACRAGCSHCCSKTMVVTQPVFAIYALFYARAHNGGGAYLHAVNQLQPTGLGCEFLRDGKCSVYPARPLVCRLYHSFDLAECLKLRFRRTVRAETMGDVAVSAGLIAGLKELSIDCGDVFLSEALGLLTTTNGVFESWLAGGDVFAPCRRNK